MPATDRHKPTSGGAVRDMQAKYLEPQWHSAPNQPQSACVETPVTDDRFEQLFRREYARVVAIAQGITRSLDEAEDVAQEAFISFHRGLRLMHRMPRRGCIAPRYIRP